MGVHARAHQHLPGRGLRVARSSRCPTASWPSARTLVATRMRSRSTPCAALPRISRRSVSISCRNANTGCAAGCSPPASFPIAHALREGRARQRKGRGCRHELTSRLVIGFHILPWTKVPPPAPCKIENIQQGKGFYQLVEARNSPRFGSDDAKTGAVFDYIASEGRSERQKLQNTRDFARRCRGYPCFRWSTSPAPW